MTWLELLTPPRLPTHPGGAFTGPLFVSDDRVLHCFGFAGKRVISTTWGYSLKVNGSAAIPNAISYGGKMGFAGSYNVWYDTVYGWVASTLPIGSILLEYFAYEDPTDTSAGGSYQGDAFYTGSFPALGGSASWQARGSLRGDTNGAFEGDAITVEAAWDHWKLPSGNYGEFEAQGEASGSKYFGVPQWKDEDGNSYPRSATQTGGHYSYGSIAWSSGANAYVLGLYGSSSGWHEAGEFPEAGESWTLKFTVPDDSEATGDDLELSWDKWTLGTEKVKHCAINASIWRSNQ